MCGGLSVIIGVILESIFEVRPDGLYLNDEKLVFGGGGGESETGLTIKSKLEGLAPANFLDAAYIKNLYARTVPFAESTFYPKGTLVEYKHSGNEFVHYFITGASDFTTPAIEPVNGHPTLMSMLQTYVIDSYLFLLSTRGFSNTGIKEETFSDEQTTSHTCTIQTYNPDYILHLVGDNLTVDLNIDYTTCLQEKVKITVHNFGTNNTVRFLYDDQNYKDAVIPDGGQYTGEQTVSFLYLWPIQGGYQLIQEEPSSSGEAETGLSIIQKIQGVAPADFLDAAYIKNIVISKILSNEAGFKEMYVGGTHDAEITEGSEVKAALSAFKQLNAGPGVAAQNGQAEVRVRTIGTESKTVVRAGTQGKVSADIVALTDNATGYITLSVSRTADTPGGEMSTVLEIRPDGIYIDNVKLNQEGGEGQPGKTAYEVAVINGYQGTVTQWLASLVGADGKSAYQVAVAAGYGGTINQWLASLVGAAGKDAYEVAVAEGFVGNRAQWLESLKYPKEWRILEKTAAYTLTAADFALPTRIDMNLPASGNLTIPAGLGLSAGAYLWVRTKGAGQITNVCTGTTPEAAGNRLKSASQYSNWMITKEAAAEVYSFGGDLIL